MKIDDCIHTFEDLALKILPEHFQKLEESLRAPWSAELFTRTGFGSTTLAKHLGFSGDFSGCYVLAEPSRPVYVGISRKVLTRVRQHMLGKTHFDASLAYSIAKRNVRLKDKDQLLWKLNASKQRFQRHKRIFEIFVLLPFKLKIHWSSMFLRHLLLWRSERRNGILSGHTEWPSHRRQLDGAKRPRRRCASAPLHRINS